jgi:hypothetical protein
MICTHCGTEIADKAIVCYRCGTATAVPERRPAPRPSVGARVVPALALVALLLAALFMGQAAWGVDVPPAVPYTVAAIGVVVLVWRIVLRRRR